MSQPKAKSKTDVELEKEKEDTKRLLRKMTREAEKKKAAASGGSPKEPVIIPTPKPSQRDRQRQSLAALQKSTLLHARLRDSYATSLLPRLVAGRKALVDAETMRSDAQRNYTKLLVTNTRLHELADAREGLDMDAYPLFAEIQGWNVDDYTDLLTRWDKMAAGYRGVDAALKNLVAPPITSQDIEEPSELAIALAADIAAYEVYADSLETLDKKTKKDLDDAYKSLNPEREEFVERAREWTERLNKQSNLLTTQNRALSKALGLKGRDGGAEGHATATSSEAAEEVWMRNRLSNKLQGLGGSYSATLLLTQDDGATSELNIRSVSLITVNARQAFAALIRGRGGKLTKTVRVTQSGGERGAIGVAGTAQVTVWNNEQQLQVERSFTYDVDGVVGRAVLQTDGVTLYLSGNSPGQLKLQLLLVYIR